jgi:hypothetical protein
MIYEFLPQRRKERKDFLGFIINESFFASFAANDHKKAVVKTPSIW